MVLINMFHCCCQTALALVITGGKSRAPFARKTNDVEPVAGANTQRYRGRTYWVSRISRLGYVVLDIDLLARYRSPYAILHTGRGRYLEPVAISNRTRSAPKKSDHSAAPSVTRLPLGATRAGTLEES
jgi:hypothetical protein